MAGETGAPTTFPAAVRQAGARTWWVLAGLLVSVAAVAVLGSLATAPSVQGWYADAEKPWFNPPNWLFGPVWTVLYVVMAIAAWLVWLRRADRARAVDGALRVWWAQLAANLAWTPTFFAAQWLWPALAVIVMLAVLVGWTIARFAVVDRLAAWLLVPYLAWVLYAAALNAALAALN